MTTAIDTNILLDILIPGQEFSLQSAAALEESSNRGSLVISDIVYAELCVHFPTQEKCDQFLEHLGARVDPLSRPAHFLASRTWRKYRQAGGKRIRILTDFFVGAHAQMHATRLLSRDRGFYGKLFPLLNVVDPSNTKNAK